MDAIKADTGQNIEKLKEVMQDWKMQRGLAHKIAKIWTGLNGYHHHQHNHHHHIIIYWLEILFL